MYERRIDGFGRNVWLRIAVIRICSGCGVLPNDSRSRHIPIKLGYDLLWCISVDSLSRQSVLRRTLLECFPSCRFVTRCRAISGCTRRIAVCVSLHNLEALFGGRGFWGDFTQTQRCPEISISERVLPIISRSDLRLWVHGANHANDDRPVWSRNTLESIPFRDFICQHPLIFTAHK